MSPLKEQVSSKADPRKTARKEGKMVSRDKHFGRDVANQDAKHLISLCRQGRGRCSRGSWEVGKCAEILVPKVNTLGKNSARLEPSPLLLRY